MWGNFLYNVLFRNYRHFLDGCLCFVANWWDEESALHGKEAEIHLNLNQRAALLRALEQLQGGQEHLALLISLARVSQCPPHQEGCNNHSSQRHHLHGRSKGFYPNHHGRRTCLLQESSNVSYGHMTDGSDRDQDHSVNPLSLNPLHPF